MRRRFYGGAFVLVLVLALMPTITRAEDPVLMPRVIRGQGPNGDGAGDALGFAPGDPQLPLPIGSTRPEDGGLFFNGSFVMYRQNETLGKQIIAVRGFKDVDGSITGFNIGPINFPGTPGTFVGSGEIALSADQVSGPQNYQPGFRVGLGWKFFDGSAVELGWMHLTKNFYTAVATGPAPPPNLSPNADLSNTFLFSGVFNFPNEFAGPLFDVSGGNAGSGYGVWNAADIMTLSFEQRNEFVDVIYRTGIFETETSRTYSKVGLAFAWFWERFAWHTTDQNLVGLAEDADTALYTNIISQRMYGPVLGCGHEQYLGNGFAVSCELMGGAYLNVVKKRVKYERGDKYIGPERKRSRTDYTVVPQVRGTVFLHWYPSDAIQFRIGYDVMAFFNTFHTPNPVDFDYSAVNPNYERTYRILDGFQVGGGIHF